MTDKSAIEPLPSAAEDTPLTRSAWILYDSLSPHFSRSIKQEEAHAIVETIIKHIARERRLVKRLMNQETR